MEEEEEEAVNFGKSIIVPIVQELTKQYLTQIPPHYLRLEQEGTSLLSHDSLVPVIDIHKLARGHGDSVDSELEKLHSACRDWGFFMIVNHGISISLLEEFRTQVRSFFRIPYEEKKKLWQQPDNHEWFGQLFVVSEEQKLDRSDMFYNITLPPRLRQLDLFAKLPPKSRETLETYILELKKLAMTILDVMAKALKMDAEEMRKLFADGVQSVRMNYYPPCPEPDKFIEFSPHSDADAVTILLQLDETEGLQIRKEGKWIPVKPLPNAFVANVGDIMEVITSLFALNLKVLLMDLN
ncbi:hypothetical protein L6164_001354 [Bauhinia variegata]|uniref:Uncharacterized protein n=1 Tax=Bauhinia variegata TaxID=167791 RepID=A0ACB9Q9V5_BAUVA|nr:hypothetical protein L6164_001354 [Bauhinia variegata]